MELLYQRRVVMLSYHLQTSQDPLVKACCQVVAHFPPRKSLIRRVHGIIVDLFVGNLLEYTSGHLREVLCAAQSR